MISPIIVKQVKEDKKAGMLNSDIMQKFNLTYGELRMILDGEETNVAECVEVNTDD